LPDYPASPENDNSCYKYCALRVGLIHHDSACPKTCGEHSMECESGAIELYDNSGELALA
jgi:hypothetical protein